MYKYKRGLGIVLNIFFAFFLISVFSCEKDTFQSSEVNHGRGRYEIIVQTGAGYAPNDVEGVLAAPFNLITVLCCEELKENDNCANGILISNYLKPGSKAVGHLLMGMRFVKRGNKDDLFVPVFLPLKGSSFKRLHDDQFRLRYDEMLSIMENWYWNYLSFEEWSFEGWVSEEAIKQFFENQCRG